MFANFSRRGAGSATTCYAFNSGIQVEIPESKIKFFRFSLTMFSIDYQSDWRSMVAVIDWSIGTEFPRRDGTSVIKIQYCYTSDKRTELDTEIPIPPKYWNRKSHKIADDKLDSNGSLLYLMAS